MRPARRADPPHRPDHSKKPRSPLQSPSPDRLPDPSAGAQSFTHSDTDISLPPIASYPTPQLGSKMTKARTAVELDKDVVRRVLARHYRPDCAHGGPSWLTLLGHAKDSLWSVDLFRAESIRLQTHWILLVMDLHTRRIIGFGGQAVAVDGPALCRMFNQAISGQGLDR